MDTQSQNGQNAELVPPVVQDTPAQPAQAPAAQASTQPTNPTAPTNDGASQDTRTIVSILLLIFAYPIGAFVALFWSRWPKWVRILVFIPVLIVPVLIIASLLFTIVLVAINPAEQMRKAEFLNTCRKQYSVERCKKEYQRIEREQPMPTSESGEQTAP